MIHGVKQNPAEGDNGKCSMCQCQRMERGPHAEIGRPRISSTKWSTPEFWTRSEENDLAEMIISD
jgi:hypothetical protein